MAALVLLSPGADDLARHEPPSLLPDDAPYNRALAFERKAFPQLASRTRTVLVFEADAELSSDHETFLRDLSARLVNEYAGKYGWTVQSPYIEPFLRDRLLSADGRAAMIVVSSNTNYLTLRSVRHVETLDGLVRADLSAGLRFEITGEGGLGRDLSRASKEAFDRTTIVTLAALLLILALVYRAPLAALVPLAAIGLSVVAALMVLNQFTRLGWGLSRFEKTIVVVLLFGSGTDFALFWLASFREHLAKRCARAEAAACATARAGPAIFSSAATTIGGLLMLMASDLLPSFNAGRALAIALSVSLAAALTLVPAFACVLGRALYWPRRSDADAQASTDSGIWSRISKLVAGKPAAAMAGCLVLLALPAFQGTHIHYTYDAFGIVPPESSAARGREIASRHFSAEQLFSWTCLITAPDLGAGFDNAVERSKEAAAICGNADGVVDVWSLSAPLGQRTGSMLSHFAATDAGRRKAADFYLSEENDALRLEIMQSEEPLSDSAMRACAATLDRLNEWARSALGDEAQVHATGLTPYILNVRSVADRDQRIVMTLVLVVILAIVLALVRDVLLAVVMLLGTVLVYLVSLGITEWFFVTFTDAHGIDWKVRLFAFVILVAVGQDYNIFLVSRLLHERRSCDAREAVRRAIARTGSVISSCGAIMAATLGSLAATGLPFFQQLGVAFATGVLVDTFLIRPVLVPAAYLLLRGRSARKGNSGSETA